MDTTDHVEALLWETRRLFRELSAAADGALEPLGLTASDRALLEFLARESGPISLAELARKRAVSRQHIHQSLARLPNPRWIAKSPDPHDARSVVLQLTGEGRSIWKEIRAIDRTVLRRITQRVSTGKLQQATRTLQEIRKVLKGHSHD